MDVESVVQYSDPHMSQLEDDFFEKIEQQLETDHHFLIDSFLSDVDNVLRKVIKHQEKGKKGEISYITFTLLRSNMLLDHHALRIDVMDDNFWYDEVEITGEWRLDYIFQNASSVYRKIINSCSSNYLKLQPYEMTKIYYHILYEHYVFSAGVLRKIVREIEQLDSFQQMKKAKEVKLLGGEFRDKTCLIVTLSGEKKNEIL